MLTLIQAEAVEADTRSQLAEAVVAAQGFDSEISVVNAAALTEFLYASWYSRVDDPSPVPRWTPPNLVEMLRGAHAGSRLWESGWRVEQVHHGGQIIARKANALRLLERTDYVPVGRPGTLPCAGDEVEVSGCCVLADPSDGWWRTRGEAWSWISPPADLLRLYWNVDVVGLAGLVERLTFDLAGEREPWLLKCAVDPTVHGRADATVCYLTRAAATRRADQLVETAVALGRHAGEARPPLTLRIAQGLAGAVDPGGGRSFGEHRCRLVAEGLLARSGAAETTLDSVLNRFAEDGIESSRPWANREDPLLPWEC